MIALTNVGTAYDFIAAGKGLGFAVVDMTGVTQIVLTVYCSKIGAGTISWQLFNMTDGAEIGVINDAGAVGDKTLTGTFSGLSLTGLKQLRIRCKSTVATDDPNYFGSNLRLVRA